MSSPKPHPASDNAPGAAPRQTGAAGQMRLDELPGWAPADTTPPRPDTPVQVARRLKSARAAAGYETASAAALAFGWAPSRYLAHESGERPLQPKQTALYASAFGVDPVWLLAGTTQAPPAPRPVAARPVPVDQPNEAMRRAAREALFALAVTRGLVPASVPASEALAITETWRELADAALDAAWRARRQSRPGTG